jgi:hypothetical protein
MPDRLKGVHAKLGRAQKHLDFLRLETERFMDSNPYTFAWKLDEQRQNNFLRTHVERPVSEEWSLVIGEFAHNARSALDALVYQLALLRHGQSLRIPGRPQFPIFLERLDYESPRGAKEMIRALSCEHRALVEQEQPYNGLKQDDPLWWLHDINNSDKHRLINTAGGFVRHGRIGVPRKGPHGLKFHIHTLAATILEEDTPILWASFESAADAQVVEDMDMKVELFLDILFADGSDVALGKPMLISLFEILQRVGNIIHKFEREFAP